MIAIRGATTIKKNNIEEIKNCSIELFQNIIDKNNIDVNDIVSIIISCTSDINMDYPGKFIREYFNLTKTAIMHFNEMYVENSLPLCIRILIHLNGDDSNNITYVYLNDAKKLRKDLMNH